MIESSTAEVWRCTICNWVWFKRRNKTPKRCPNPRCRKAVKMAEWITLVNATVAGITRLRMTHGPDSDCRTYRCFECIALGKKF